MEHAKEVEEDLLNTLEESGNEVLELKSKLQHTAQEVTERERTAYEVIYQYIYIVDYSVFNISAVLFSPLTMLYKSLCRIW